MTEPTDEQIQVIRQQVYDKELRLLIRDTIDQLQRLGDRLESHIAERVSLDTTLGPGLGVDDRDSPDKAT